MTDALAGLLRVFVVGCPRSGTTLLQTMLGQHPAVLTIPETHYLEKIRGRLAAGPVRAVVSPRAARAALTAVHEALGHDVTSVSFPTSLLARPWERAFVAAFDAAAVARGAPCWVEKSPVHLHWLARLRDVTPGAQVVHVLRDGRDVVASFHRLCLAEPDRWVPQVLGRDAGHLVATAAGRQQVLDAVVDRWNADVATSLRHAGEPGHHVVVYERLVADPPATLRHLCADLGLPYAPAMLRPWEAAPQVVGHRASRPHMRRTFGPVAATPLATFHEVLGAEERDRVTRRLTRAGALPATPVGPQAARGRVGSETVPPRP